MALVIGGRISSSSSNYIVMLVAAAILLAATTVSASFICGGNWVYPFESRCTSPARYYGEVYELVDAWQFGMLAPEWDESNSTYYVRFAEEGAKYRFGHWSRELRVAVAQSDDVRIVNVETGRALGWRQEGENEWFLVEVAEAGAAGGAFQFANYVGSRHFACPLPYPPLSCGVYSILDFGTSLALSPYVEDNATYVKLSPLSETDTIPFRLRKVSSTDMAPAASLA